MSPEDQRRLLTALALVDALVFGLWIAREELRRPPAPPEIAGEVCMIPEGPVTFVAAPYSSGSTRTSTSSVSPPPPT
jgi:hypothetical protein